MPRPIKPNDDKSTSRFDIRLKDNDKSRIETRAKKLGMSTTNFFVEMALNGKVIVNDNSLSFFEFSVIHQLREVGLWLNKSFTHRANITGEVSDDLLACLKVVHKRLNFVSEMLNYHADYSNHLASLKSDTDKKNEWKAAPPVAIHPKLAFQLNGLRNNLKQLHSIAILRDAHPQNLALCITKVDDIFKCIF